MKKRRLLIVLFFVAIAVLAFIIYAVPKFFSALEDTVVLKYGTLPVTDSGEALIVRNETLFVAGEEGRLDYKIKESTKVRKGTSIVSLTPERVVERKKDSDGNEIPPESEYGEILKRAGKNVKVSKNNTADMSGVVSYHVDGYEKSLTPKTIKDLDGTKIENINDTVVNLQRETTIEGDPIYKTAKNTSWYLVLWKEKDENITNYKDNTKVKVNIGKTQIDAKISAIYEKAEGNLIVLQTDMYYKYYSKYRKANISVVFAEFNGLIVDNKSITKKDGVEGVYVKQTDESYEFTPVNILATSGSRSVLSVKRYYDDDGQEVITVNYYEEILVDPKDYRG